MVYLIRIVKVHIKRNAAGLGFIKKPAFTATIPNRCRRKNV